MSRNIDDSEHSASRCAFVSLGAVMFAPLDGTRRLRTLRMKRGYTCRTARSSCSDRCGSARRILVFRFVALGERFLSIGSQLPPLPRHLDIGHAAFVQSSLGFTPLRDDRPLRLKPAARDAHERVMRCRDQLDANGFHARWLSVRFTSLSFRNT